MASKPSIKSAESKISDTRHIMFKQIKIYHFRGICSLQRNLLHFVLNFHSFSLVRVKCISNQVTHIINLSFYLLHTLYLRHLDTYGKGQENQKQTYWFVALCLPLGQRQHIQWILVVWRKRTASHRSWALQCSYYVVMLWAAWTWPIVARPR